MPEETLRREASGLGFSLAGIAPADPGAAFGFFERWVDGGMAGPLTYLADHRRALRRDARSLLPSAKSVLCVGKLYKTQSIDPPSGTGRISRYAWGPTDYHDVMWRDLDQLVERLHQHWGEFESRVCVDTAPLLERAYARQAGLGWIGRNTCLINEGSGSWYFLGEILISLDLTPGGTPPPDRCGTCRRCIDACPTQALVPVTASHSTPDHQLDASRCISTLTIELKGAMPEPLRASVGEHIFGCDICQDVCPWNRRAPSTSEAGFQPTNAAPSLNELAALTPEAFRARFRKTPVWRTKYAGLLRNVAVAMGNSGQARFVPHLEQLSRCGDPMVEEHARWGLDRLRMPAATPTAGEGGREEGSMTEEPDWK